MEAIARRHGLLLIDDAAHAIEAVFHGRKIGTIGDLTCFSFYVTKNVVTAEGGMVTTDDAEFATKIKMYALHGMSHDAWMRFSDEGYRHYQMLVSGFKYNMTDLQAALGIHQLPRVFEGAGRRQAIWVRPAPVEAGTVHTRHLYAILIATEIVGKSRNQVLNELTALNIGTGVHYTPVHLHPYYRERFEYDEGAFPNAEYIGDRTLSLPLSTKLTDDDVGDVIAAVRRVCQG